MSKEKTRQKKDVGGKEHIVIYKLQVGSIILPEQPIKEKSQSENLFNRIFRSIRREILSLYYNAILLQTSLKR